MAGDMIVFALSAWKSSVGAAPSTEVVLVGLWA